MQLDVKERNLKTANEIYKTNSSNKFNRAIAYYRYARVIISSQESVENKDLNELLDAKDKIRIAIQLFRNNQDVAAQLMFLQALDNYRLIENWIDLTQNKNQHPFKDKP